MPNNFKPVHAESPHNTWLFTTHPNTNATANAPQKRTIKATKKITEKQTVKREVPGICLKPVRGLNWPNIYMYLQLFNCKYSPRKLSTVRSLCYLSNLLLKIYKLKNYNLKDLQSSKQKQCFANRKYTPVSIYFSN